ncbi:MAG: fumarylacetoacetate hydrolase family protein [Alphaproteobacteria bacterium]|nr:fumarylacetoacetate hydrolase family protein [Alphaproteobacteria bacterium]
MVADYRLLTYRDGGKDVAGVLVGDRVYPAATLLKGAGVDASSVLTLLGTWTKTHRALAKAAGKVKPANGKPLKRVKLLAPVLYPRGLFCAGANYWDHKEEMASAEGRTVDRSQRPAEPWFFLKTAAHSIIGPDAPVHLPAVAHEVDWEAELGVVIGKGSRDIPVARAMDAVAGYTIVNDLSARDLMVRKDFFGPMTYDWVGQKCFTDAAPMGPWITPASSIADVGNLSVKLWVNGALKQNSNTKLLIHNVPEQVAYLSRHVTLMPGDVIATGTPAGVGMPRGEFLKPGDVVAIEIEGCGTLTNPIA